MNIYFYIRDSTACFAPYYALRSGAESARLALISMLKKMIKKIRKIFLRSEKLSSVTLQIRSLRWKIVRSFMIGMPWAHRSFEVPKWSIGLPDTCIIVFWTLRSTENLFSLLREKTTFNLGINFRVPPPPPSPGKIVFWKNHISWFFDFPMILSL